MNVAIFGATGFVGKYLLEELKKHDYNTQMLIRKGSENKINISSNHKIILGDISNKDSIKQTLKDADAIIYTIGIIREFKRKKITFDDLHHQGVKNVIEEAERLKIKRFILMSANGVKKEGTKYQTSKYLGEMALINSNLNWTIFRPSLIFGNSDGREEFCAQLKKDMLSLPFPAPLFHKGLLPFNAGQFKMSPIHVKNVASFFVKSLKMDTTFNKTYELGGPDDYTWKEIIKIISNAYGKNKWTIPAPVFPIKVLASFLDSFKWFPITNGQLTMLLEGNTCNSDKTFEEFNIKPIKFDKDSLNYLN
tara:strand:- start:2174 stop:3094 length:921 start_codon:yes stop_codon:yes gene_type:complete